MLVRSASLHLLALLTLQGLLAVPGVLVGVDLGSQFFKAAIVSPGKPFDIVHNQHSKRKTPTAVSFHEKVRAFGDDALANAARGLPKTPMFFMHELGRNLTLSSGEAFGWLPKMFYPYKLGVNNSGSLQFELGEEGDGVTMEEATAHVLSFIKDISVLATETAGAVITEAVMTVPSTATQLQRRALLAAAEIARLPGVQLLHETSAAALQRAPDLVLGTNDTANTSTVLYYNMGARHVEVCVVTYRSATHMSKPTIAMDVLGCGSTSAVGGHLVDMLIAEEMRNAFGKKNPKLADGLATSVRALRKLEKEAMSMKHVLSANKEAHFRVEALFEDTDFAQAVSRETLETWCAPLFKGLTAPIEAALQAANVTLEDVDTVEMIGGAWRMPKVQSLLSEYLQSHRSQESPILNLSQHLNGEEAMATGAAFFGANSSASFRTKKIFFTDVLPHSYSLLLSPLNASQLNATEESWHRGVELFPAFSKMRAKKTVKLHVGFDIAMTLLENGNPVAIWEMVGIHEATHVTHADLEAPLISLKIDLDASGVVQIASAQAIFDQPYNVTVTLKPPAAKVANTTDNATEGDANASTASADEAAGEQKDEAADGEAADALASEETEKPQGVLSQMRELQAKKEELIAKEDFGGAEKIKLEIEALQSQANASSAEAAAANNTVIQTKIKKVKVSLSFTEKFDGITPRPLSSDEKEWARSKLDAMNAEDTEVKRAQSAKNELESFVYESREKVAEDENCLKVSTEEQREEVAAMLMATEDWLYEDEAMNGNASVFESKIQELNAKVYPIRSRAFELENRPQAQEMVDKVKEWVNTTLEYVKTNLTWVAATEIEGVVNLTIQFDEWYANVTTQQASLALTETPAFTVHDVQARLTKARSEALRLTKIKKIEPMPYRDDYGKYGGYGGYGGSGGGYDDKMKDFYRRMYENSSANGTNYSDWFRSQNYSNYSGFNDSDYMRSFYEHAARNFSEEEGKNLSNDSAKEEKTEL
jgi:molecular chaperone DnaK (HSP70)